MCIHSNTPDNISGWVFLIIQMQQFYKASARSIIHFISYRKRKQKAAKWYYIYDKISHYNLLPFPFGTLACTSGLYLAIAVSFPQASLLRVVEPFDPDHHAGAPWLPEALHSAHVGQLGTTGWKKHGAVSNTHHLFAPHNGLVEKLPGFTLQTSPLSKREKITLSVELLGTDGLFYHLNYFRN